MGKCYRALCGGTSLQYALPMPSLAPVTTVCDGAGATVLSVAQKHTHTRKEERQEEHVKGRKSTLCTPIRPLV